MEIKAGFSVGTLYENYTGEIYSIQVPKGWKIAGPSPGRIYFAPEDPLPKSNSFTDALSVQFSAQHNILDFSVMGEKFEKQLNPEAIVIGTKKIKFCGQDAFEIDLDYKPSKPSDTDKDTKIKTILMQLSSTDHKLVRVSYWYQKEKEGKLKGVFEKMLGSFRLK